LAGGSIVSFLYQAFIWNDGTEGSLACESLIVLETQGGREETIDGERQHVKCGFLPTQNPKVAADVANLDDLPPLI
jgi:hypothetical protein